MKRQNIIIGACIAGGLISLGLLAVYAYGKPEKADPAPREKADVPTARSAVKNTPEKSVRKPKPVIPVAQEAPAPEPVMERAVPLADEFPLRPGSQGPRVERLQVWLMRNYGRYGMVSGTYDADTAALVKRYLKADELDEETYKRLNMGKPVYQQTSIR